MGARNLQECLLLQLDAVEDDEELSEGHDFPLERALITEHLKDLEMNRYPQISRKLGRPIEEIQRAVEAFGPAEPVSGQTDRRQRRSADHARCHHLLRRGHGYVRDRDDQRSGPEPVHQRNVPQNAQGPVAGQEDPRIPFQQRAQRPLAHREHRAAPQHDYARDPGGRGRPARFLRQRPGISQTAADDPRGRPIGDSRRHGFARRFGEMDSNPPRRVSRCAAFSPAAPRMPKAKT